MCPQSNLDAFDPPLHDCTSIGSRTSMLRDLQRPAMSRAVLPMRWSAAQDTERSSFFFLVAAAHVAAPVADARRSDRVSRTRLDRGSSLDIRCW